MYFNILSDIGVEIHGYLIPDGYSSKPHIMVRADGVDIGPLECDIYLEGPHRLKHHETGMVGFTLTPSVVPGLSQDMNIEITDSETGLTFYRRLRPNTHVERRVFRLETQFAPHTELDRSLKPYFQFYANGVEHYGSETVRQMLEIVNQPSTYVSGRILLKTVQQYFDDNTVKITSLRDPFYELAIRLSAIANFKRRPFSFISKRDEIIYEPAMAYFADTSCTDEKMLAEKIKLAPKDILELFESPFAKQLVATSPNEVVPRESLANALDILSQFTLVEPDEESEQFSHDIGEVLSIDPARISFKSVQPSFIEIAAKLKEIPLIEHLLETDLLLFHFVQKAKQRASRPPL